MTTMPWRKRRSSTRRSTWLRTAGRRRDHRRLARRLQFTEAALYRYFPGKAAIIAGSLRHLSERLFATMLLELMPEAVQHGHVLESQVERHAQRFALRNGLLLELLIFAAGGATRFCSRRRRVPPGVRRQMTRYFEELQELKLTATPMPPAELSRLWICQLLGGFVRCRLTREPGTPSAAGFSGVPRPAQERQRGRRS